MVKPVSRNQTTMAGVVTILLLSVVVLIGASELKETELLKQYQRLKHLRPLGVEFAEQFQNDSIRDLDLDFYTGLPIENQLLCLGDMAILMQSLAAGNYWAIKSKLYIFKYYFLINSFCS